MLDAWFRMAWGYVGGELSPASYVHPEKLKGPWSPTSWPPVPENVRLVGLVHVPAQRWHHPSQHRCKELGIPHRVDPARWLSLMVYEPAGRGFESRWLIAGFSDLSGLKWVRDNSPGIERSHGPH